MKLDKRNQALVAFNGEIEHLKILMNDLESTVDVMRSKLYPREQLSVDEIILLEFRISLVFSFFYICIEYKEKDIISSIIKSNKIMSDLFLNYSESFISKLRRYRNKTLHENVNFLKDMSIKEKLNIVEDYELLRENVEMFVSIVPIELEKELQLIVNSQASS